MWQRTIDIPSPAEAAARLRGLGGLAWLDSARLHPRNGRWSILAAAPFARFDADLSGTWLDGALLGLPPFEALDALLRRYRSEREADAPPFAGGLVGTIDFEAGHLLEDLHRPAGFDSRRPLLGFGLYDTALVFDHEDGTARLVSAGFSPTLDAAAPFADRQRRAGERLDLFEAALAAPAPALGALPATGPLWRSSRDAAAYAADVERVKALILDGEVYQANLSRRLRAVLPEGFDPFALYLRLRAVNPAPYAAFLEEPHRTVASASPELFLRLRDGHVETRPIKGTIRRSGDEAADRAAAEALLASPKDRAENVMIVDLLRNDLSRVCEPDSVDVPELCALESYAGLHHLVSAVTGRLRPGLGVGALIAAAFPGGSITGAPKIRATDIVATIEGAPRGLYCGSVAALSFCGAADLSISIRTLEFEPGTVSFGTGGGVTILSDGPAEWAETETKAARILAAFEAP
ncbi:anthranilate synthase component I family protein [Aureimonas phyllosphaerae]|uniref:Para-aminobenzoate synthetase component 1 n=1 Tax=Aureimonas phyllosphaerae TaxID=1166078 RepID=A0A7W6BSC2_9HYPH|nr:anthranilate synthase component I family protein [Aureimonas phyllosphaerae]MBB3937148.1 para-aminobenzoate synthetase component 1 [Aureimonas phyllosphaerae]MBB3961215.1 para-aminobenzoate synthetase component 1 [Aureimonas phyllosphaerae]SFF52278.1 aminodeoxychorismate synthase, subunit I [Aureimonas phyllosphaerae]